MSEHKAVKRYAAQHDLFNRIHSITADEGFVNTVNEGWYKGRFAVVANQRCGNWYCDPSTSSKAYAYFKSTDGHMSHWDFNLRRSNLSFAKYAEEQGGVILVDSTRRGKRMPDGLSKTVPIWCAVINLALALRRDIDDDDESWDTELYLPPQVVPPTERSQIEDRLDEWAETLESSTLPLPDLCKPLRPFFIHPSTSYPPQIPANPPYTPIICLSASRWVNNVSASTGAGDEIPSVTRLGGRTVGFDYVPGGGDDDELWARGLTPPVFHSNKRTLLSAERDDLPHLVDELVLSGSMNKLDLHPSSTRSKPTGVPSSSSRLALDIGDPISHQIDWASIDSKVNVTTLRVVEVDKHPKDVPYLLSLGGDVSVIAVPSAKTNSRGYDIALHEVVQFVETLSEKKSLVLRPEMRDDVERAIANHLEPTAAAENDSNSVNKAANGYIAPTSTERKLILPIALVLLCRFPSFSSRSKAKEADPSDVKQGSEAERAGGETGEVMSKSYIADRLHTLVSLWPDGNPPRASLKRVNEFLMSGGRRG